MTSKVLKEYRQNIYALYVLERSTGRNAEALRLERYLVQLRSVIEWQIDGLFVLTSSEKKVLYAYYLDYVPTWEQVADKLNYSISRVYQLRRSALEKLDSIDNQTNVQ